LLIGESMRRKSRAQHVFPGQAHLKICHTAIKQPLHIVLVGNLGRRLQDTGTCMLRRPIVSDSYFLMQWENFTVSRMSSLDSGV
jgi:hypothetical protein